MNWGTILIIYAAGVLLACFAGGMWWKHSGHPMGDTELAIFFVALLWPLVAAFTAGHVAVQIWRIGSNWLVLRLHRTEG